MRNQNGECLGYIPDGYTTTGYIRGVEGLYPSLTFKFRPLQRLQQQRIMLDLADGLKRDRAIDTLTRIYALLIHDQVVEWDLHKNRKELVDISDEAEILRVQPALFERLVEVLMGRTACDIPPTDTPRREIMGEANPAALLHAAMDGEPVAERLEKN